MPPGRKAKPTEQKRREGNPGKRPLPGTVLVSGRGAPPMPAYLPSRAKTAWKQIVPALDEIGALDRIDGPALEALCIQVAIMREATAELKKAGRLLSKGSQGQPVRHPLIEVINSSQDKILRWCERFGLDPAARGRMGLQGVAKRSLEKEMKDKLPARPVLRAVK